MFYLNDENFGDLFDGFRNAFAEGNGFSMMQTDIKEDKDGFEVLMNMPGIDKKDVKIDFVDGYLTVSVDHKEENDEKKDGKYVRRERRNVKGTRSFYLGDIDETQTKAKFENGVLNVSLKKTKEVEAPKKYIEIE